MSQFIVLEGIEGVGKTTNMDFIANILKKQHIEFVRTREPGGTALSEHIRDIVLHVADLENLDEGSEMLLMFAARAQHLAQVIKPALAKGQWVLSDRFTDATYAYQGGGRGIDAARIKQLEHFVQGDIQPDHVILLDVPVDIALERTRKRHTPDRIEKESAEFFERVRQVYLQRAKADTGCYHIVDASKPLDDVQNKIEEILISIKRS